MSNRWAETNPGNDEGQESSPASSTILKKLRCLYVAMGFMARIGHQVLRGSKNKSVNAVQSGFSSAMSFSRKKISQFSTTINEIADSMGVPIATSEKSRQSNNTPN